MSEERYQVWPYGQMDDNNWSIQDEVLMWVWKDLIERDRAKNLFYSGGVKNAYEFIDFLQQDRNSVILIADDLKKDVAFISWLNGYFPPAGAFIHYASVGPFRWGAAKRTIEHWKSFKNPLTEQQMFMVLIGVCPTNNKAAYKLMRALKFKTMEINHLVKLEYEEGNIASGVLGALSLA